MSDDLHLTRRGLLQMVVAVITTASFAARRPLFLPIPESPEGLAGAELVPEEALATDRVYGTRLEHFLRSHGVKSAHLARASGYSREFLLRLRLGRIQPTRCCIARVTQACRRLTREHVHPRDLFDFPMAAIASDRHVSRQIE